MSLLRRPLVAAVLALCLGVSPVFAEEPPKIENVQQSLDALADRKLPEAEQLVLKQTLEQTLRMLQDRQTADSMASPDDKASRVNLLNWDGKGTPECLFPPRGDGGAP